MSQDPLPTRGYRAEIDGLRAVAVMLVVAYHAGYQWFGGGFVGVDVFFVISGFLITGIVWRDIASGRFTFRAFYRRRLARLMPALMAVMIGTTGVALVLLTPSQLVEYAQSVMSVVFAGSNVFFWRTYGGYFGGESEAVPLLHTWSLAVEEQFYFVWPVVLVYLYRWRKIIDAPRTLVVLSVLGIALSEWVLRRTIGAAYYLLPTRGFQLILGGATMLSLPHVQIKSRLMADALAVLGLGLIAHSASVLGPGDPFPGFNALPATLGACAVLLATAHPSSLVARMLSWSVPVTLGRASYSIYLWHWPISAFLLGILRFRPDQVGHVIVTGSLLLGLLSWRLIEERFREPGNLAFRDVLRQYYILPGAVLVMGSVLLVVSDGVPKRFDASTRSMDAAYAQEPRIYRGDCHSGIRDWARDFSESCIYATTHGHAKSALLIGDSHANHFGPLLEVLAADAGVRLYDYTMDTCAPLMGFLTGRNAFFAEACFRRNEQIRQLLQSRTFDFVILGANWPAPTARTRGHRDGGAGNTAADALRRSVDLIEASGARPVIILPAASAPRGARCVLTQAMFRPSLGCGESRAVVLQRQRALREEVTKIQQLHPQLRIVDPLRVVCASSECVQQIDGIPLFLDRYHLNTLGSSAMGRALLREAANPLVP